MMRIVALLAVVGLVSAARLTWNADNCNTDFNNRANWEPKRAPKEDGTPAAKRVIFGTNDGTPFKAVNSFVVSGEYSMGELILPEDGILTLEGNGVTLNFVEETSSDELYFTAGQKFSEACDFTCHKNWITVNKQVSKKPVCDGDDAIFTDDHTYKVFANGIINLDSIRFGDDIITNKFEIPDFQIYPEGDRLDLIFGDNDNCAVSGLVDEDQKCFCHSTCVGEPEQLVQNTEQRNAAKLAAGEDQKELLEETSEEFFATYDWRSIARSSVCAGALDITACQTDFEDSVECAMEGYNFTADALLVPAMTKAVADNVLTAKVEIVTLSVSGNLLRVAGNVVAPFSFFRAPGPNGELRYTWVESPSAFTNVPGVENPIFANMWRAFAKAVLQCSYDSCKGDIAVARTDCDATFPGLCSVHMDKGLVLISKDGEIETNVDLLMQEAVDDLSRAPEPSQFSVDWNIIEGARNDLTVMAGDSIIFTWNENRDLAKVSQATFDRCNSGEEVSDYSMGSDEEILADNSVTEFTETPNEPGTYYYISTVDAGVDCSTRGIRLKVVVTPFIAPVASVSFSNNVITPRDGVDTIVLAKFLSDFAAFLNSQDLSNFERIASDAKTYWTRSSGCLSFPSLQGKIAYPVAASGSFPGTWAGMLLPQFDINQIVNPLNAAAFRKYLEDNLKGVAGINGVSNVKVEMMDPKADRRRNINSSGAAVLLLWVTFDYTKFVLPTCRANEDNINCLFSANTRVTRHVNAIVDDLTTLYEVIFPVCFSTSTGFDQTCLRLQLKNAILDAYKKDKKLDGDVVKMKEIAEALYKTIAGCGMKGADATGKCIDAKSESDAKVAGSSTAVLAAADAQASINEQKKNNNGGGSQSSTSGGSGGLPIIPIAAGAGGGLVLIIIVVLLVRRRKNNVAPKGADGTERTVVAFENPMYDDPGQNTSAGAYDHNGGLGGESEGLYDEPAFTQAAEAKQNPMYQSSEDLAAEGDGGEEAGGGYLDVAPEDQ